MKTMTRRQDSFLIHVKTICIRRIIILLTILFFTSCQDEAQYEDHPEYLEKARESASRLLDKGETERALSFYDSAYNQIENPGLGDKINKYNFKGAGYYRKMGDYEAAIANLDSIISLLSDEDVRKRYIRDYADALFQKGDYLFNLKRYYESYKFYYRGKIVAEQILDPCAISEYTYRLGMVGFKQGKFPDAITNFKQCLTDVSACTDDFANFAKKQELLANIALSYSRIGLMDSAIVFSHKALAVIDANERKYPDRKDYLEMAKGVIYGNQADMHAELGSVYTAEKLLIKSFEINSKNGYDSGDAQITLLKLGELYLQNNKLESAWTISEQLKESLDTLKNLAVAIRYNKLNWKYYDKQGNTQKAYAYLQQYMELSDSMAKDTKVLVMADFDKEFDFLEQRYKYATLKKKNDLKKVYLLITLIVTIMTMAIVLLLYQNWRASKRNVGKLTNLNKQVTFQNLQLEQTLSGLKQSNEEKDKILKVVAHDLRNPIGAIANITTILLDEADLSEEHRDLLNVIDASSWQSIEMINDLLTASLNNRPADMKMEWVNMNEIALQCIDQLRFKADEKKQKLELNIEPDLKLWADGEKLRRVMSNLIINAVKFSPPEGVIKVKIGKAGRVLEFVVTDNGIGIPEEYKNKVFDMFTDAKRQGTSGEQPFGLGLSFSKQIVEAHGGKIWFESVVNKGTTFHVELPI